MSLGSGGTLQSSGGGGRTLWFGLPVCVAEMDMQWVQQSQGQI